MKPGQKRWKSVKCPYYRKHSETRIYCKPVRGAAPFATDKERLQQMQEYCKKEWPECRYAAIWEHLELCDEN